MNNVAPEWAISTRKGKPEKYPLSTMEIYQVHSVSPNDVPPSGFSAIRVLLHTRGKMLGRTFVARQLADGTVEICRMS